MDSDQFTKDVLAEIYARKYRLELAGYESNRAVDSCPFIEQGSTAVRWDGSVHPCLPLLHTNQDYWGKRLRHARAYTLGNVQEKIYCLFGTMKITQTCGNVSRASTFHLAPSAMAVSFPPTTKKIVWATRDWLVVDAYGRKA